MSTETGARARERVLELDTLNPNIRTMEYAVRGPIVARAEEIENELKQVFNRPLVYLHIRR